jgi:adenosylcobinamide kinase/adenosylcobinamide-phosphate guanylyltransferase
MLIYITGGARSGKSRYALAMAQRLAKKVVFVATCLPTKDKEMHQRIKRHRQDRPKHWTTLENQMDLSKIYSEVDPNTELLLIDCLTMYVSGRLMENETEAKVCARVEKLCKAAAESPLTTILVSNEVGCGVVPATDLGLKFRDYAGRANQIAARYAQEVYWLISGIPVPLKGGRSWRVN